MINSIMPRQIPYAQGQMANAVNIQIFNPQAHAGQNYAPYQTPYQAPYQAPAAMPFAYTPIVYPVPVYPNTQLQPNYQPINQSLYMPNNVNNSSTQVIGGYPQNYNNDLMKNKVKDAEPVSTDDKKPVQEEQKPKVQLTDEYIMSLENYLNNSNPKIRLMASKEILDRFGEDKSRAGDPALTALLNKVLQDPTETVRFMGLTTLDLGYARGDNLTVQILKQIQQNTQDSYGEDALLASQVLLKMSAGH